VDERKRFTHGSTINLPPMQHSLEKELRSPWHKQADMGAKDPSLLYNETEMKSDAVSLGHHLA